MDRRRLMVSGVLAAVGLAMPSPTYANGPGRTRGRLMIDGLGTPMLADIFPDAFYKRPG